MERSSMAFENDLNLKATELRLGLPGRDQDEHEKSCITTLNLMSGKKRASPEISEESRTKTNVSNPDESDDQDSAPPPKAQVVGWPPVRSYRKNIMQEKKKEGEISGGMFVKVRMDGAPYLRKIDLKMYSNYKQLLTALETMFKLSIGEYSEREGYNGSEYAPTYQDKDGDWMLVGDVPWNMFICSCKRLRIMKGSEPTGLGCL